MKKIKFPKLYARTKSGQLRSFVVKIKYRDEKLAILITKKRVEPDGKITWDKYTYTKGKNIGRANETTALEQANLEAISLINRLKDKGYSTNVSDALNVNKKAPEPMLAIKWDESKISFPCMVQPKLDGVRCIAYKDSEGVHLKSRRGKEFNIPHLKKFLEKCYGLLPLDGELYNHDSLSFQGIISAVKKVSASTNKLGLIVYDKPVEGVTNYERQFKLLDACERFTPQDAPVKYLKTYIANNLEEVYKYHQQFKEEGYEGAIIRNYSGMYEFGYRSNNLIKLKDFYDEEFQIVDVHEASGRDKGTALFVLQAKNGEYFNARPQGDRELRARYLRDRESLIGKMCTVKYQELSKYGIPRFPSAISVRDYE